MRCAVCGKDWSLHVEPVPTCLNTLEAIVKHCYWLTTFAHRSVVLARLAEAFPHTHLELLVCVERGLTVARSVLPPEDRPSSMSVGSGTGTTSTSNPSVPPAPPASITSHQSSSVSLPSTPTVPPSSPASCQSPPSALYVTARSFLGAEELESEKEPFCSTPSRGRDTPEKQ